ncbi:hypothetical protein [Tetragenococcus halophilus]|uniref:hypothetical protein n=2 Tax=Tetragenococcus halophilus TaxID=51669 RepID=UPI0034A21A2F
MYMAMNNVIDLDNKLSLTKNVRVAGKDYSVKISDEVDKALSFLTNLDMPYQLFELQSKVDLLEGDETDVPSLEQYHEFTESELNKTRESAFNALDKVFGEGEGRRIYEYYNESTKAVMTIIDLLQEELGEVMKQRNKTAKNHYQNKNKNRNNNQNNNQNNKK